MKENICAICNRTFAEHELTEFDDHLFCKSCLAEQTILCHECGDRIYRSPYYALAYAINDLVLIVLWTLASLADISYVPMVACFVMFFANDIYGFINWQKMKRKQKSA